MGVHNEHKLLIANRGEIALRILHTAKRIGMYTVAIYTPTDSLAPHVLQANESVLLQTPEPTDTATSSEAAAYLSVATIIGICRSHSVTLVHPGYGFLSENADFATQVIENGMIWLGPSPQIIRWMGMKHEARSIVQKAGVQGVPGSIGLLSSEQEALDAADHCGFPVMLKATAGGGGMGMIVCHDAESLTKQFQVTKDRAQILFQNDGVFLERYFEAARHIEIQIFGNGHGDVVHLRERECSIQRRHQKVVEESPSPFCMSHPGVRERMCDVAVRLARVIKYNSAGTIEFLVDDETAEFYFLEMNTRIQVEHPVTEQIHPGLDLVELMIKQGIAELSPNKGLPSTSPEMSQATYDYLHQQGLRQGHAHAIEGRIYAENPYDGFVPAPGLLQHVSNDISKHDWLRIDSWIETGMTVTSHFDPLLAKVIVSGASRDEALKRFLIALEEISILGPPNNIKYLASIAENEHFCAGLATTNFLETFSPNPRALKVLSSGIDTTIQDLLGRRMKLGVPVSGPMDSLGFASANILVGNPRTTEGLEIVVVPGVKASFYFYTQTNLAVTGKDVAIIVNNEQRLMWSKIAIPPFSTVDIEAKVTSITSGFRVYMSVTGGFPDVPVYLGSKSTSMGLGGYQGRSLKKGDMIFLGNCTSVSDAETMSYIPQQLTPSYPTDWVVYVLPGPHGDEEFITADGIQKFYSTHWRVSPSSNRLGIRLETPTSTHKIEWARDSGGEGGSHPSNILDNGYAPGTININGDTPVILTSEGPDMGGYLCLCTVASAEMWKLGQLALGNTVQFRRISWATARQRSASNAQWLETIEHIVRRATSPTPSPVFDFHLLDTDANDMALPSVLRIQKGPEDKPHLHITFRQAGDSAILVEFGEMHLDIFVRARIHAFQGLVNGRRLPGVLSLCPCIRSILCHYDPNVINQDAFLCILVESASLIPENMDGMTFPGRRITFPIVMDDKWNKEAIQRYMSTTRDKATYLPSNVEYLAKNNGLGSAKEALEKLIASDWLVLGVGFYLACPFLIPIDPRCRLIGQKMNPSRTFTPRGAIGIAGPVAAIYPIESPGGYQLYGRTLPTWQTWGKGVNFRCDKPWLLEAFDQVTFQPVSEDDYIKIEKDFDAGQYVFQIEPTEFSVKNHIEFLELIDEDLQLFRTRQAEASKREARREKMLLREWEEKNANLSTIKNGTTPTYRVAEKGDQITSPLFANIWKIKCRVNDVIESESEVLIILEAMKTEIPVYAGEGNVSKCIVAFGQGVEEGHAVSSGDTLIVFGTEIDAGLNKPSFVCHSNGMTNGNNVANRS